MEPKIGDRVSLDAKKVGQPRRSGVVKAKSKGLSGVRYEIRWDDGHSSMIAPGGGVLLVEGKAQGKTKAAAKSKSKKGTSASAKRGPAKKKSAKRRRS